jgi:hypothetical protein
MSAAEQVTLAGRWLSEDPQPRSGSVTQLWHWLADPGQADAERVFFESCGRSLRCKDGPQARFAHDAVTEWLPPIVCLLAHQPRADSRGRHAARHGGREAAGSDERDEVADSSSRQAAAALVLAVLHGLLLDLLATGDRARVQDAFDLFGTALDAIAEPSDL